jgi:hypothetical protein
MNQATGRELDERVAREIYGWPWTNVHDSEGSYRRGLTPWQFDMASAWELVEKFNLVVVKTALGWYAMQKQDIHFGSTYVQIFGSDPQLADTAPEAICMAALKINESQANAKEETKKDTV